MSAENKPGAAPTENRSENDNVLVSLGKTEPDNQGIGSKSPIHAATPDANANAAIADGIVPENEMPRTDGTLSASNLM